MLNRVFELAGVSYGPRPQLGTKASVEASKQRKADSYGWATGKHTKVPANKKSRSLKIIVPMAKTGVKRPCAVELALVKPVKRTKKFVLDSPMSPASGLGDAGASSSKAPAAVAKRVTTSVKGQWIQPAFLLGAASAVESQELLPHNPMANTPEEAPAIAAGLAATFAAADTTTLLPIVTATAGSRATASLAFATASAG
jgi:hypothetical protein